MTTDHSPEHTPSPVSAQDWDEKYGTESMWSGNPNETLVSVAGQLETGSVLDVGCGEGADAVWLAQHGWQVTALDVSRVAVERGQAAATDAGVDITWFVMGLGDQDLGHFDLVSAQYPAVPKQPERAMERTFGEAVRPGGRLLFVHHELDDRPHGFDPADYVMPQDMVSFLGSEGWEIELDEVRERHVSEGAGSGHTRDRVILARRPQ